MKWGKKTMKIDNVKPVLMLFILLAVINQNALAQQAVPVPYSKLSNYQRDLFDTVVAGGYDELNGNTGTRNDARFAEGLLYRDATGDRVQAALILDWLFSWQNTDTSSSYYGNWPGTTNANDYSDQNRREFTGTELIIIHNYLRDRSSKG